VTGEDFPRSFSPMYDLVMGDSVSVLQWSCSNCSHINPTEKHFCIACSSRRPTINGVGLLTDHTVTGTSPQTEVHLGTVFSAINFSDVRDLKADCGMRQAVTTEGGNTSESTDGIIPEVSRLDHSELDYSPSFLFQYLPVSFALA